MTGFVQMGHIWHAYADGPGDGSYLNKLTVEVGILGGSTFQKWGKFHELPRKSIKKKFLPRRITFFLTPTPWGGGENFKVTRHQVLKSISGMQLPWAKPGSQREGG